MAAAAASSSYGPQPMDEDDAPEDRLVAAYDVHVCSELPGLKTQLVLLQQPLRPRWRPYDLPSAKKARFKPKAQRLELDIPIGQDSANYDKEGAPDHLRVPSMTLRSSSVDAPAPQAIGVIRDGKLLLMGVDYALQLRPHMPHLNVSAKDKKKAAAGAAGDGDASEDEGAEAGGADEGSAAGPSSSAAALTAIEVQVKRRETERQQQARLNSYGHLTAQEEAEPWVALQLHSEHSGAAHALRSSTERASVRQSVGPTLSRSAYLSCFVPASAASQGSAANGSGGAAGLGVGAAAAPVEGSPEASRAVKSEPATPEMRAAMAPALQALFRDHSVCSMADIRSFLSRWGGANAVMVHQAALLDDRALRDAVTASGAVVGVRRVFVRLKGAKPGDDALRGVVIEMLKQQESVKKGDIMAQADTAGVAASEAAYLRIVKDLCVSKGGSWTLKDGV